MELKPYYHEAKYYETDQMGIIHHSNYIRWMEEARVDFFNQIGISYKKMEEMGIISPVLEVKCKYERMVRFGDVISIQIKVEKYTGVKLVLSYEMVNTSDNAVCTKAESSHCFLNKENKLISLKKEYPEIHKLLAK